jgi:hypothetical protein
MTENRTCRTTFVESLLCQISTKSIVGYMENSIHGPTQSRLHYGSIRLKVRTTFGEYLSCQISTEAMEGYMRHTDSSIRGIFRLIKFQSLYH